MIRAAETGGAASRRDASALLAAHAQASCANERHDDAPEAGRVELGRTISGSSLAFDGTPLGRTAFQKGSPATGCGDKLTELHPLAPLHVVGALQGKCL